MADARKVVDILYRHPVVDAAGVSEISGKINVSACKFIAGPEKQNILKEFTGGRHGRFRFLKTIWTYSRRKKNPTHACGAW
jgi:hypothetical protein